MSVVFTLLIGCVPTGNHRDDFKKYFDQYNTSGCFEMYNLKEASFTDYNPDRCTQRFIPSSTFNIFLSLVALQTKIISEDNSLIKWDSAVHAIKEWNQDQDLSKAIKNSVDWYFQELARKIGESKLQQYLTAAHYGNMNIGGAIDSFWMNGTLRISGDEQIEFLKNLNTYQVPFSNNVIDFVKQALVLERNSEYTFSGISAAGAIQAADQSDVASHADWFIGYVENENGIDVFATNIDAIPDASNLHRPEIEITKSCLKELGII